MKAGRQVQKGMFQITANRQGAMGGNKPEYPNGQKYLNETMKADQERISEQAKVRAMAKRPMKRGKISKGKGRRG